ncbi:MAG: (Fe-S)-binding protein [Proteobacteria bacterium]|nr:(Fe-S)-binding protein [Pseudomonadota bacterium]
MRKIYLSADVDAELCQGDKICENICVAKAVRVVDKKAFVDDGRCVSCMKCLDACPTAAIAMTPREEPLLLAVNTAEAAPEDLKQLCAEAHLDPEDIVCVCTFTTAKEIAAAVLGGAKTPEEVTLATGARSACGMWCIAPILRVMNAHGLELPESDGYRWYNIKVDLWNAVEDVDRKYPEYRLEEDRKLFREGIFHSLPKH